MKKLFAYLLVSLAFLTGGVPAQENSCGGIAGVECGQGQFCKYGIDNACGIADQLGVCTEKPAACIKIYMPVCGCDSTTYSNACMANAQGVSVAYVGTCRSINTSTCRHVISCGIVDGVNKQFPTPCDANDAGATNIVPMEGDSCPAFE